MNLAAIFDLDGTLADTALDLLNAGNLTFEEIGINCRHRIWRGKQKSSFYHIKLPITEEGYSANALCSK